MKPANRHLLGAFAAMLFVGASWGANLPVSKVMLSYFDLVPMSALRIVAATAALAALLWLVEGRRALAVDIGASRLGVAVASLWVNMVPFFAVLWSMAYGFVPNVYQIAGGLVALSGVFYMQWRKLQATRASDRVPA